MADAKRCCNDVLCSPTWTLVVGPNTDDILYKNIRVCMRWLIIYATLTPRLRVADEPILRFLHLRWCSIFDRVFACRLIVVGYFGWAAFDWLRPVWRHHKSPISQAKKFIPKGALVSEELLALWRRCDGDPADIKSFRFEIDFSECINL